MAAAESSSTLYERIGGEAAIETLVDEFYRRVLADEELAPFFEGTPMDKLRLMQRELFAAALDGPVRYTGRPLSEAHFGRGIQSRHLRRFFDHLLETLQDQDLDEQDVLSISSRIARYADEITGQITPTG